MCIRDSSLVEPYQNVINTTVRLVSGLWSHDHDIPAGIELHWLPAEARIQCVSASTSCSRRENTSIHHWSFSTCCRHVVTPLSSAVGNYRQSVLFIPRTRLLLGEQAFRVAASKAWNHLPHDVSSIDGTNTLKN